ncbi:hypothetical protein Y788_06535 [Pantoea dispersa 625]|nr:hypothetical protein Y788_06535 [Pantoea dispersa 625]
MPQAVTEKAKTNTTAILKLRFKTIKILITINYNGM